MQETDLNFKESILFSVSSIAWLSGIVPFRSSIKLASFPTSAINWCVLKAALHLGKRVMPYIVRP